MIPGISELIAGQSIVLYAGQNVRFYKGQSMHGTFRPGDCLIFVAVSSDNIRVGDVIIFRAIQSKPDENDEWVHRVVDIRHSKFVTRGDNNSYNDLDHLIIEDIIGKVTHISRNGKTYIITGGRWGFFRARCIHARHSLMNLLRYFFGHYYRLLKKSKLIPYLWKPDFHKLFLKTDKGLLVKYINNGYAVACWWPEQNRFEVVKPFDLVIPHPEESK